MKPNKNKDAAPSLKKLEYLSLVSKVCTELESHLGFSDKTLAEFITDIGFECLTVDDFDKKLKKNGDDLPDTFVRTLFNAIHARKPKGEVGEKGTLAIGDSREHIRSLEKEIEALEKARGENLENSGNPERWEVSQMIALGVLSVKDYPVNDGMVYQEEGGDGELEVELKEDEPVFLKGQSHYLMDNMSPVKIFKNSEGSLSRAAALQSALIKERREVRDQQQRTMLDSIPKDLNRPWEDPMPENGERHLAQELRGVGLSAYDMPEWKKDTFSKALTFGQRSKLSLQEQRQSLPIYKLKKELVQAVNDW